MSIKVFHLNTECNGITNIHENRKLGMLPDITKYVNDNKFDLVALQEVSADYTFKPERFSDALGVDGFKYYSEKLNNLKGEIFKVSKLKEAPNSYYGVAIFYNDQRFILISADRIHTNDEDQIRSVYSKDTVKMPYGFLSLKLKEKLSGLEFFVITGHLTWGPISYKDTPVQYERAKVLSNYIKTLKQPVILTLDMNVEWFTKTSSQFEDAGLTSLARKYSVKNTLNPLRTKFSKQIFVDDPVSSKNGGVAVDNVFISKQFRESDFKVVMENLSDHYALNTVLST